MPAGSGDSSEGHQSAARTLKIAESKMWSKMRPYSCEIARAITNHLTKLSIAALLALFASACALAQQQDLLPGLTYVCSGERLFVENCNMRDPSDTATCMVGHPDQVLPNGIMKYTYETRGSLKKLFPTCTQPSAKQVAAAQAFQKRQQDTYNANVQKSNEQLKAATQPITPGQPTPPKTPEERAIRRCVSSGRLPATCTGNQLLGAFSQMFSQVASQVAPGMVKEPEPGPVLSGVFEGSGSWRLDFIDGGVLVNCSVLAPNQEAYAIDFKTGRATLTINTTPKPLVLTMHGNETIVGPGPITLDGVINTGVTSGGGPDPNASSGLTDQNGMSLTNSQAGHTPEVYKNGSRYYGSVSSAEPAHAVFAHKRVTCPALNLSSKGASTGIQTMQTDMLKSMFSDGDKGAPTPPGIRMQGIYAASSTGFSVQFFPESAILGCGPDAARAYPYIVVADGTHSFIKVDAPDHPLTLAFSTGNSLDPGTGAYQVHGRITTGQNDNGDFTFAPNEQTCNLAVLTPSKSIPSTGGVTNVASNASPNAAPNNNGGALSTPAAPLGNATLTLTSGLPAQPGTPNPLAGRPLLLLRESYADGLAKAGVTVPPGTSPYKYAGAACAPNRTPDCQKISEAVKANAISAIRADANGSGTLPGVPPGTYYLMISARYNNQSLIWGGQVQLKPGTNSLSLDLHNATPLN
jgi:hypothetical protein